MKRSKKSGRAVRKQVEATNAKQNAQQALKQAFQISAKAHIEAKNVATKMRSLVTLHDKALTKAKQAVAAMKLKLDRLKTQNAFQKHKARDARLRAKRLRRTARHVSRKERPSLKKRAARL